ncbi:MAG: hypothetical protein A2Z18_07275 [Armatimonadetes bacterium RBG_16_58_9]|nr:MAG: hypothetical protein A2Z18_07275 [Armatimonadetes bacterium RBG_16_58_9]
MNAKRYVLASLAVFVVFEILDYVIHSVILMKTYEALASVWRPDMMQKMWILYITVLVVSFLFVYIFSKGYEAKGIAEGVRYGLVIGLFMQVPAAFSQYAVYPIPLTLAVEWFVAGMIEFIICGIVAAAIYRPAAARA